MRPFCVDFNVFLVNRYCVTQEFPVKSNPQKYSATISNSKLNIENKLTVSDVHFFNNFASQLVLKNCETNIANLDGSKTGGGASMIVEGGVFNVGKGSSTSEFFSVWQGSSLTFRDANVDFSGAELSTKTDSSYSNSSATINVENSTFVSGYIDLYGYDSSGALPAVNITKGSHATIVLEQTYDAYDWDTGEWYKAVRYMRGGTITVSGENTVLIVKSSVIQGVSVDDQVYTSSLVISDDASAYVEGVIDVSRLDVENGNLVSEGIIVRDDRTLNIAGNSTITADYLSVFENARVTLSQDSILNFEKLEILIADLESGMNCDLVNIFGERFGDVLAAVGDNVYMSDYEGNSFYAEISGSIITAGAAIPEPATCAAIFGVLAWAFAAYRKRR